MKYYVLKVVQRHGVDAAIHRWSDNLQKTYRLKEGLSLIKEWPDNVILPVWKNEQGGLQLPEGTKINDCIHNSMSWLIINEKFKKILEENKAENLEFLPVKIKDHKGKILKDEYWIANFTKLEEAIDLKHTKGSRIMGGKISTIEILVLRKELINSGHKILRVKECTKLILVREDLMEQIKKDGITIVEFIDTDKYATFPELRGKTRNIKRPPRPPRKF